MVYHSDKTRYDGLIGFVNFEVTLWDWYDTVVEITDSKHWLRRFEWGITEIKHLLQRFE